MLLSKAQNLGLFLGKVAHLNSDSSDKTAHKYVTDLKKQCLTVGFAYAQIRKLRFCVNQSSRSTINRFDRINYDIRFSFVIR